MPSVLGAGRWALGRLLCVKRTAVIRASLEVSRSRAHARSRGTDARGGARALTRRAPRRLRSERGERRAAALHSEAPSVGGACACACALCAAPRLFVWMVQTGLGDRVATMFVKFLGKSTLGLAYGLALRCEGLIFFLQLTELTSLGACTHRPFGKVSRAWVIKHYFW